MIGCDGQRQVLLCQFFVPKSQHPPACLVQLLKVTDFGANPEPSLQNSKLSFRQVFADALEVNTTLKELVLNKNGIGVLGTQVRLSDSDCQLVGFGFLGWCTVYLFLKMERTG